MRSVIFMQGKEMNTLKVTYKDKLKLSGDFSGKLYQNSNIKEK